MINQENLHSIRMSKIRQTTTKPEWSVRQILWQMGLRYRVNVRGLPGTPDIAVKKYKKAIFVHGCFWHRHAGCSRSSTPRRNIPFWSAKFKANVARDERKIKALEDLGYQVLVIWECESENPRLVEEKLRQLFFGAHSENLISSIYRELPARRQ